MADQQNVIPSMRLLLVALLAMIVGAPALARAADSTTHVTLSTQLHSRTSLRLSTHVLVFSVAADGETATATLDYVAAARTRSDGEVVLSVEPLGNIDGSGGAADVETDLWFTSGAQPMLPMGEGPVSAARWTGSGLRQGRLAFALRAAASGTYVVPMRFVLSTP